MIFLNQKITFPNNLNPNVFTSDDGCLLRGMDSVILESNNGIVKTGSATSVTLSPFNDACPSMIINGKERFVVAIKVGGCKIDEAQSIMKSYDMCRALFHCKEFAGVVSAVVKSGDLYDIYVRVLSTRLAQREATVLEYGNIRFSIIDSNNSVNIFNRCIPISSYDEVAREARYGNTGIIYNREFDRTLTIPTVKMNMNEDDNAYPIYLNSNYLIIDLAKEIAPLVNESQTEPLYKHSDTKVVMKSLNVSRTFFLMTPESKALKFIGNACYFSGKFSLY